MSKEFEKLVAKSLEKITVNLTELRKITGELHILNQRIYDLCFDIKTLVGGYRRKNLSKQLKQKTGESK